VNSANNPHPQEAPEEKEGEVEEAELQEPESEDMKALRELIQVAMGAELKQVRHS